MQEYVANGGNGEAAALKAYDVSNETTAAVIASENLNKPNIRNEILRALQVNGIGADRLVEVVRDAIGATKSYQIPQESGGGLAESYLPDHTTRLKAATLASKWLGIGENAGSSFHLHLSGKANQYNIDTTK